LEAAVEDLTGKVEKLLKEPGDKRAKVVSWVPFTSRSAARTYLLGKATALAVVTKPPEKNREDKPRH